MDGASATLARSSDGADFSFHAKELKPSHVYTLWFVVVNSPEKCTAYPKPCTGPDDVIGNTDSVQADVTYANGIVAYKDGRQRYPVVCRQGHSQIPGLAMASGML